MNQDFVAAMRRAYSAARASQTADATAIVRRALAEALPAAPDGVLPKPAMPNRRQRRSLAETIATLRAGGPAASRDRGAPAQPAEPPMPAGARFERATFANAAGSRPYRLYVPASAGDRPRGLVVMLHGCRQNATDFAIGTRMNAQAERHRLLVLYPEQTSTDNGMGCWQWFDPANQRSGRGEPAIIAGMTGAVAGDRGIAAGRTFVAGLSAGGAMAAILADSYPERFAGCAIHSGLAPGLASDVAGAFAAMRGDAPAATASKPPQIPLILFHGTADSTVLPVNADIIGDWAADAATPIIEREGQAADGTRYRRRQQFDPAGRPSFEDWRIEGGTHAWSGGDPRGSFAAAGGPDASAEMIRFFLDLRSP